MKLFLTIFLTIFFTSALSGLINLSGGDDYTLFDTYFDRVNNLFYAPVQGSCSIVTSKGKQKDYPATVNLTIYDFKTKSQNTVFQNSFNNSILSVYFEQTYNQTKRSIIFNTNDDETRNINIKNNFDIERETLSNNLIITTYDFQNMKYALWICTKQGTKLSKVAEFEQMSDFYIDVFNKCILVVKNVGGSNQIIQIQY